jgi:LacI family transcriptional regulator
MTVRMKDIAQEMGLSVVTISKALRNHPDIAKETRERILQLVKDMNYRPNLMARSLVTGRSSLIGLVVPDLIHPFFAEIAKVLSGALRRRNYFLLVSSSDNDPLLEQQEIEHMLAHRLDAMVVASSQASGDSLKRVSEGGPPLILLDRYFPGFACNFVGADDHKMGEIATEHLLSTGKKRIAHIRGPENNVGQGRLEGYRDALRKRGIASPEDYILTPPTLTDGRDAGAQTMKAILALRPCPDAVFCFNDTMAVGAIGSVLQAGLRVPQDIAIIGCGNHHYDDMLRVPLSTVDQKIEQIGQRTAKLIFSLLDAEGTVRPRKIILEPELLIRESSQKVK